MKKIAILLMISALSLAAMAQVQVYPYVEAPGNIKYKGSIHYALPTTTLKMTVSVSKVQDVRGYFADYAESLLGLTNIIQQNRTYYTLNSVDVEPIRTADLNHCYRAYTNNAEIADSWAEYNFKPAALAEAPLKTYTLHAASLPDFFKNYADISYTQQSEAFVDTKIIDGVVTQVPASHTKTVSKSFESKAREAADAIVKSRKDQYALAAGEQETPYSSEALQTMLSELKKWENNYMSLFTGVSISDTIVYVLYVTPENTGTTVAFYFDANKGLNPTEGKESDAYSIHTTRLNEKYGSTIKPEYPLYGMLTRMEKPVFVTLMHKNAKVHDFGIMNMYQAGPTEVITHPKQCMDIDKIGIVF